jgi:hypothetical protein
MNREKEEMVYLGYEEKGFIILVIFFNSFFTR